MSSEMNNGNNVFVPSNFIHRIIDRDIEEGIYEGRVHTRFPPEPNGYLHIGSAYAININYSIAEKYRGKFNLRFDDTNPRKEETEYVDAIIDDMKWLGCDWEDRLFYASDYFDALYEYAVKLIKKNKAFVCDLTAEEVKQYRGTLTEPGKESPYRNRDIDENLDLFERMKNGEFPEGSRTLRAKIDMSSSNTNMRDPVLYRIQYTKHHRTGDKWCIYPMYDYAHPISDAIENITHSLCSIEFLNHRPLYDWCLEVIDEFKTPPKQREFGRMSLRGVVTSKRYLREMVEGSYVDGWDDPRMPTLRGLRRRGYTPEAIRHFLGEIGVSKDGSTVDVAMLEHSLRDDLKLKAPRKMAVLQPLKVIITNYPEDQVEWLEAENNPENEEMGTRKIPFSREIYIERDDFMEDPPKKFFRLFPGNEVRLRHAYFIKCEEVIKDEETGEVLELRCTYDPETKSGSGFTGRKVKGTLHWVSAPHAVKSEVRLYDSFLLDQEGNKDWKEIINPNSLIILDNCYLEPSLGESAVEDKFQFLRHGYFCVDTKYSTKDKLVFNRTVSLKDSYK
ncbi:glutamine--tRNA ligase/YqeY domain fusion protein [Alkaliphilus peptidifermentans]|uniref:Glutamine--tRNA ligase n=1 Tax=Alkaliphilus peptidifermentans DSM 18978 TaxID=1120976 RepID=A0A1G5D7I9_9FIRM|nr:glutamine--tRNA ligase/YqeY domain fusion protein [Alkaliphilus peptidifermentans]SCY10662.1 glutaminyl-tRNA synthetase [Alkaliphilus peptidifermentans DSM 18978]